MAYNVPLDIYNRALQNCGRKRIWNTDEPSDAKEINACYDSLRLDELERNLWTFATKRVILRPIGFDTVLWTPPAWSSGSNYSPGAVVNYTPASGPYKGQNLYWCLTATKTGSTTTPDTDPDWHVYTGPVAVDLYDTGVTTNSSTLYQAGEVVLVPAAYSALTTYAANNVVSSGTTWYVSLTGSNTGNAVTDTTHWAPWVDTGRNQKSFGVTASGSPIPLTYPGTPTIYVSLYNMNADNPVSATGNWLSLGGAIEPLLLTWPVGAGPAHDITTKQAYRLPYAFMRQAPTDPRGGAHAWLGAASGSMPEDYVIEHGYLVSATVGPLMLRFVASVIDVSDFHPMFAEGLAARIASEVAAGLVEDKRLTAIMAKTARDYASKISQARAVNAIEVGPVTPVENRYVTVRY